MISDLSKRGESGNDPSTVGQSSSDGGGWSYGVTQFNSADGVVQAFVQHLQEIGSPYGDRLANAGDPTCDQSFVDEWKAIAAEDPEGFLKLQEDYSNDQYYWPGVAWLKNNCDFDIEQRSEALKQVLYANSVQHGPRWGPGAFDEAAKFAGKDLNSMTDAEIIIALYEMKVTDMSWSERSPDQRYGLFQRWRRERRDALALLGIAYEDNQIEE